MKKKHSTGFYYLFFIFLFLFGFLLINPGKKVFMKTVNSYSEKLLNEINTKTGLTISYDSLSLSVLSAINLKKINLIKENENVLSIDTVKINYSLWKILKKDFQNGINDITIDGVEVDLDSAIEIINSLSKESEKESEKVTKNESNTEENSKSLLSSLREIKNNIPKKIHVKNVYLVYNTKNYDAYFNLKKINLNKKNGTDYLNFDTNCGMEIDLKLPKNEQKHRITSTVNVNGNIDNDFKDANVHFSLLNITDGNYRWNQINLYAEYKNKNIEVKTVQSVTPININVKYNNEDKTVNAQLTTQNLKPLTVISTNANMKNSKKLKNLSFTSNTKFNYFIETNKFEFNSQGNLDVPEEMITDGINLDYEINGNEQEININSFNIEGKNCLTSANLNYQFKNMQLSGFIEIPYFLLPNGNTISTELYFDPLEKGFMAFSPQIFLGESALTAMQFSVIPLSDNSTYDFTFEVSDYSHLEQNDPGLVTLNGSYLSKQKYFQTNVGINGVFIDSLMDNISAFLNKDLYKKVQELKQNLNAFALSGDFYFSSDLETFSYNVPYVLVANTKKNNQAVMLSLNGNNENIQLNQLSFVFNQYALQGFGSLEKTPDKNEMFFTMDFNSSSIPYHFAGSYSDGFVTVTGDYNFTVNLDMSSFAKKKEFFGNLSFKNLPLSTNSTSLIFTVDTSISYDKENGPVLQIVSFDTEVADSVVQISPKCQVKGNVTKYGAQLNSIIYSDSYSILEGNADVTFNMNQNMFNSAGLILNLKNTSTEESIIMDTTISNPDLKNINLSNIKDSLYITSQINFNKINLNRFTTLHNESNLLTTSLYATGTINHPYVVMNVDELKVLLASDFMVAKGIAIVEDRNVTVQDFIFDFNGLLIDKVSLNASLETMTAHAEGTLSAEFDGEYLHLPMFIDVTDTIMSKGKLIPDSCKAAFYIKDSYGDLLKKPVNINVGGLFVNDILSFYTVDNPGIYGTLSTEGKLQVMMDVPDLIKGNVDGEFSTKDCAIKFSNLEVNLENVCSYLHIDNTVLVQKGVLQGYVNLLGSFSDPDLRGAVKIINPRIILPTFCTDPISGSTMLATITKDEIKIVENTYNVKDKKKISFGGEIYLNKWKLDHIEAKVGTINKEQVYGGFNISTFKVWGDVDFKVDLYYENNVLNVKGDFFGENIDFTTGVSNVTGFSLLNVNKPKKPEGKLKVVAELDIDLGTHVTFNFDPILRCVLFPDSKIKAFIDQQIDMYQLIGTVKIKSGDIAYLNRNFYIKEGSVKLNPEDFSDPQITLTAETREKDDNGDNVRIILTATNQYLKNFYPSFSSIPPKSESQLRNLMGQVAIADSENPASFIFAASDYAIQSTVLRKAENKLRDFMKFDIFSLRTNILQNTLNTGIFNSSEKQLTLGTILDNSTIYIGKYLESSIYIDAMLHVSFEDKFTNNITEAGDLLFQPEIGFELDSPFANIRWNFAPDINAMLNNQFVPASSVTLSWKWAF